VDVSTLWQDVLYGFRMLLKKPGFTAVAALSLALGIGANTVIFSLINSTLLRPLGFPDSDKLMVVWSVPLQHKDQRGGVNGSSYFAFRDKNRSFEAIGAFNGDQRNLGAEQNGAPAERIQGQTFTPSMFRVIGVSPELGRPFTDADGTVDDPAPVVLISHRFWQRHFNGDRNAIGKTLILDKAPVTVIGVMPADFTFFGDDVDFWAPQPIRRLQQQSKQGFLIAIGRLKLGVSMRQSQAEMDTLAAQLASGDPERNKDKGAWVQSLQEAAYGGFRSPLLILQGAVAFVLLIGCANVAGLLLARAASRRTEVAIRTALGADRWRIVRQLITESFPLSVLGGILGIFLSWAGLKAFIASAPPNFPRINDLALDARVLGFTVLIVILTAVIFGVVPAIQASKPDLVNSLKESGRGGTDSVVRQRLRSALVTLQIALALVLLIGAGLMINSFVRLQKKDLGANPRGLLTFEFRFPQGEAIKPFGRYRGMGVWDVSPLTTVAFQRVFERMQGLPGVLSAAAITRPPLVGGGISMPFLIEGRPAPPPSEASEGGSQEQGQSANYFAVTPNFFATMKIPLLRGRDFTAQDTGAAPPVIIVNQTLARRFFANDDPIGKRLTLDFVPDEKPRQIVAVAGDTTLNRFQDRQTSIVYVPYTQQTPRWMGPYWFDRAGMYFVLRTAGDPMSIVPAVRRAVADIDPNKPAGEIRTVEAYLDRQVQYIRLYILLLGIFGGIAAVLAAIGIYGVMAYSVAERTREIGIRMALGAGGRDVLALVARQALILISLGLLLGLAGSFALTRVIKSALVGVTPTDPATYTAVSLALAVVALLACFIPTRRAVAVDPTVALRYE
jgi:putative ABC transport system permease protein